MPSYQNAIIGAGNVGSTLDKAWAKMGWDNFFGVRYPQDDKTRQLIESIDTKAWSPFFRSRRRTSDSLGHGMQVCNSTCGLKNTPIGDRNIEGNTTMEIGLVVVAKSVSQPSFFVNRTDY